MSESHCVDCGRPNGGGLRCPTCHGAFLRRQALDATAVRDRQILDWVKQKRSMQSIATRLNLTRTRAAQLVGRAQEREEQRLAAAGATPFTQSSP